MYQTFDLPSGEHVEVKLVGRTVTITTVQTEVGTDLKEAQLLYLDMLDYFEGED